MIREAQQLLARIRSIHAAIRDFVVLASEQTAMEQLASIVAEQTGDTIFAIDRISEEILLSLLSNWARLVVRIDCGRSGRGWQHGLPSWNNPVQAELRIIVDPIDGTRGLMYQKRGAWISLALPPIMVPAQT